MPIFTHVSPDLDAAASVWATRKFVPGASNASVEFRHAAWDGSEMEDGDIAVDMSAGGRGVKGLKEENGVVHSSFRSIVERYASDDDQRALASLVAYVDAQDSTGNAERAIAPELDVSIRKRLSETGLNAVFRAIQSLTPLDDGCVVRRMIHILDGMLELGRIRVRAGKEIDEQAEFIGPVAIIPREEIAWYQILFEDRGVRAIVFHEGNGLGVMRGPDETLRMDHPVIRAVVKDTDEENAWFAHSSGFLYCWGTRKSPQPQPSAVNPRKLAEAVAFVLSGTSSDT